MCHDLAQGYSVPVLHVEFPVDRGGKSEMLCGVPLWLRPPLASGAPICITAVNLLQARGTEPQHGERGQRAGAVRLVCVDEEPLDPGQPVESDDLPPLVTVPRRDLEVEFTRVCHET